jgi:hypothetical protein
MSIMDYWLNSGKIQDTDAEKHVNEHHKSDDGCEN